MTLALSGKTWYDSLAPAGVMELVDVLDSKASTPAVSNLRLTLDFSTVLRYDGFGSFTSSLLGSLLSLETGENRDSKMERCAQPRAGVMELVDVADSKSAGLIPRVGSSPTTGTIGNTRFPGFWEPGFSCPFCRFSPVVLSYLSQILRGRGGYQGRC